MAEKGMKNVRFTHKQYVEEKIPVYEEIASLLIRYFVLKELKKQIENSFVKYNEVLEYEKKLKDYENKIFGSILSALVTDIRKAGGSKKIFLELKNIIKKHNDKKLSRQEALYEVINEIIRKSKTSVDLLDKIIDKANEKLGIIFTRGFIRQIQSDIRRHIINDFDNIIQDVIMEIRGIITIQGDTVNIDTKKLRDIIKKTKVSIKNQIVKDKEKNFNVRVAKLIRRYITDLEKAGININDIKKDKELFDIAIEIASKVWKLNLEIAIVSEDIILYDESKTINISTFFNTLKRSLNESKRVINESLIAINEGIIDFISSMIEKLKSFVLSVIESVKSMWKTLSNTIGKFALYEIDESNRELENIYRQL